MFFIYKCMYVVKLIEMSTDIKCAIKEQSIIIIMKTYV